MLRVCLILLAFGGLVWGLFWGGLLPPAWNPRLPLDIRRPITPVTALKLAALAADPAACRAALAASALPYTSVPDSHPAPGCGYEGAVRVTAAGGPALSPSSFVASCPLAIEWALFEKQILTPLAQQRFGSPVATIRHLGSYNCREVRGSTTRLSAHARADALDFAGVTLADGREIAVEDWRNGQKGAFLHALRDGACRVFGLVLSPDYNRDHAGHFHLQAHGWGLCR